MEKKDCRQLLKDTLPLLLSFVRTMEEVIQKIVIVSFFLFVLTRKRKLLLAIYKDVSVIHMLVRSFIKTFDFKKFFSHHIKSYYKPVHL